MFDFGNYDSGLFVLIGIFAVAVVVLIIIGLLLKKSKTKKKAEADDIALKRAAALNAINFHPTFKFNNLQVDENSKQWNTVYMDTAYSLDNIEDCTIVEDGVAYKSNNGVMRAVIGGALFGNAGAVVGAVTGATSEYVQSLEVWIYTKTGFHHDYPLKITVSNKKIQKGSSDYAVAKKDAERIINAMTYNKLKVVGSEASATADDLIKYKQLLESGVITQAEFDDVKSKLISKL